MHHVASCRGRRQSRGPRQAPNHTLTSTSAHNPNQSLPQIVSPRRLFNTSSCANSLTRSAYWLMNHCSWTWSSGEALFSHVSLMRVHCWNPITTIRAHGLLDPGGRLAHCFPLCGHSRLIECSRVETMVQFGFRGLVGCYCWPQSH